MLRSFARKLTAGLGLAAGAYAAYVGTTWYRYGRAASPGPDEEDELLDRFMPTYDVVERHNMVVAAPPATTLAAAREMELLQSPAARAIIKGRELLLGATPGDWPRPRGLLAEALWLGWGILAERADREVVVGAVTRPWEPNVTFRSLPPEDFAGFSEGGCVKIVWTLRADPLGAGESTFRTETRAVATDADARAKFRRYWAAFSPGIILMRRLSLGPLKKDAERRARAGLPPPPSRR